jgi:hypothetical protein
MDNSEKTLRQLKDEKLAEAKALRDAAVAAEAEAVRLERSGPQVFVIEIGYDYEGFSIFGIYSSRELAEAAMPSAKASKEYADSFSIVQFALDVDHGLVNK